MKKLGIDEVLHEFGPAKRVKIFYKNGTTYTLKNVLATTVVLRPSGGCDVEYIKEYDVDTEYGFKVISEIHATQTEDVVGVEFRNLETEDFLVTKLYQKVH